MVIARAGVSEREFAEVYESFEQCAADAFDDSLARVSHVVERAAAQQEGWLEHVRGGLVALLGFFDDEPQRARLLVLNTPVDTAIEHRRRRQLHGILIWLIDAGGGSVSTRIEVGREDAALVAAARPGMSPALTAELVVGGVFSVIRTAMLEQDGAKLVELAPSLMAFIVTPYLGPSAARLELQGKPARRREASAEEAAHSQISDASRPAAIARTATLPIRVTHRTTLVLRAIAQTPYSNNREIAHAAGITDEGQASKLLARLEQRGVIENVGVGPARGEPNAWLLTASGRRAVEVIGDSFVAASRTRQARVRSAG